MQYPIHGLCYISHPPHRYLGSASSPHTVVQNAIPISSHLLRVQHVIKQVLQQRYELERFKTNRTQ